jgi:ribonuclease E
MSRQRLRPGMLEATTQPCPHCHGTGLIRSDDSLALSILRQLEEEGTRQRSREVLVKAPVGIVNFLINQKREHIAGIEARYGMAVRIEADPMLVSPDFVIEKFKTATRVVRGQARQAHPQPPRSRREGRRSRGQRRGNARSRGTGRGTCRRTGAGADGRGTGTRQAASHPQAEGQARRGGRGGIRPAGRCRAPRRRARRAGTGRRRAESRAGTEPQPEPEPGRNRRPRPSAPMRTRPGRDEEDAKPRRRGWWSIGRG